MHSAAHPVLHRGGEAALVTLTIGGGLSSGTIKMFDTPPPSSAQGQTAIRLNPLAFSDGFFATEALRNYLRLDIFLHAEYHKIRGTKRAHLDFYAFEKVWASCKSHDVVSRYMDVVTVRKSCALKHLIIPRSGSRVQLLLLQVKLRLMGLIHGVRKSVARRR